MRSCKLVGAIAVIISMNSQISASEKIDVPYSSNQYSKLCQSALEKMRWVWKRDVEDLKVKLSDPVTEASQRRLHAPAIQSVEERIQENVPVFRVILQNGQTAILKLQQIRPTDLSSVNDQNIMQNKAAEFGVVPEVLDFLDLPLLGKLTVSDRARKDWYVGTDFYGYLLQDLGSVWNTKESTIPREMKNWKKKRILKRVRQIRRVLDSLHIKISDYQIVLTPDGVPFTLDFDGAVFNPSSRVRNHDPAEERLKTILK